LDGLVNLWTDVPPDGPAGLENNLRGLTWSRGPSARTLVFIVRVPVVAKSIDLCLLNCSEAAYLDGAAREPANYLALRGLGTVHTPGRLCLLVAREVITVAVHAII
jgi:hypothetical protein